MKDNYLSIDIGGTNIKHGLLNHSGVLIENGYIKTEQKNLAIFLNQLYRIVDKYIDKIKGIAISVPGKIDKENGVIYFGGSLTFLHELPIKEIFSKKYQLPVAVENDGKSAALAEFWLGNLQHTRNSAAIVLGTGVGGGIFLNGELLQGSHSQAGELSFMINNIHSSGKVSLVGESCSAVKMIQTIAKVFGLTNLNDGLAVFNKLSKDDGVAKTIFEDYCKQVAMLIMNIQAVIDVDKIVIGGGISEQRLLIHTINNQYAHILNRNLILKNTLTPPEICAAHFTNKANLYGVLYSLLLQIEGERLFTNLLNK